MAWTAPITFVSNTVLTAAQLNTYLRDNLNETAPAKATTPGYWFVAQGPNSIAERAIEIDIVNAAQESTETSFVDLATIGPQITCTTGTRAIYFVTAQTYNLTSDRATWMGVEVSGASSIEPSKDNALIIDGLTQDQLNTMRATAVYVETGLTPGENTFTCKYYVETGTGHWSHRQLVVMAL